MLPCAIIMLQDVKEISHNVWSFKVAKNNHHLSFRLIDSSLRFISKFQLHSNGIVWGVSCWRFSKEFRDKNDEKSQCNSQSAKFTWDRHELTVLSSTLNFLFLNQVRVEVVNTKGSIKARHNNNTNNDHKNNVMLNRTTFKSHWIFVWLLTLSCKWFWLSHFEAWIIARIFFVFVCNQFY